MEESAAASEICNSVPDQRSQDHNQQSTNHYQEEENQDQKSQDHCQEDQDYYHKSPHHYKEDLGNSNFYQEDQGHYQKSPNSYPEGQAHYCEVQDYYQENPDTCQVNKNHFPKSEDDRDYYQEHPDHYQKSPYRYQDQDYYQVQKNSDYYEEGQDQYQKNSYHYQEGQEHCEENQNHYQNNPDECEESPNHYQMDKDHYQKSSNQLSDFRSTFGGQQYLYLQGENYGKETSSEKKNVCPDSKTRALDLSTATTKLEPLEEKPLVMFKKAKKEVISAAHLLENFKFDDSFVNNNPLSKLFLIQTPSTSAEYIVTNQSFHRQHFYSPIATDYSTNQQSYVVNNIYQDNESQKKTEPVFSVEGEFQIPQKETREVSVQTDSVPMTLIYSRKANAKFRCSLCQRFYATKGSYERHLKTHLKEPERKIMANVRFTTEAKLQIYKRQVLKKKEPDPIIIQIPRLSNPHCGVCEDLTSRNKNQVIIAPPMVKCPECPVQGYTKAFLNEHIALVHKKEPANNAYCCIFCNESFDAGYKFHLHLDNHLTSFSHPE